MSTSNASTATPQPALAFDARRSNAEAILFFWE
jgi:hypothetical protein